MERLSLGHGGGGWRGCYGIPRSASRLTDHANTHQMLLRMKNSWMKMQPKGRMPPMTIPGRGFVKKDCSGIWRGIWFVRTGCSMGCGENGTA